MFFVFKIKIQIAIVDKQLINDIMKNYDCKDHGILVSDLIRKQLFFNCTIHIP